VKCRIVQGRKYHNPCLGLWEKELRKSQGNENIAAENMHRHLEQNQIFRGFPPSVKEHFHLYPAAPAATSGVDDEANILTARLLRKAVKAGGRRIRKYRIVDIREVRDVGLMVLYEETSEAEEERMRHAVPAGRKRQDRGNTK